MDAHRASDLVRSTEAGTGRGVAAAAGSEARQLPLRLRGSALGAGQGGIGLRHTADSFKAGVAFWTAVLVDGHTSIIKLMKLRIHGNALRLRVKQGEVTALAAGETLEDRCELPGQALVYRLTPGGSEMGVTFADGVLTVAVPAATVAAWAGAEQVGMAGVAGAVEVLVEKDWRCLDSKDPRDNEDTFPHPAPVC